MCSAMKVMSILLVNDNIYYMHIDNLCYCFQSLTWCSTMWHFCYRGTDHSQETGQRSSFCRQTNHRIIWRHQQSRGHGESPHHRHQRQCSSIHWCLLLFWHPRGHASGNHCGPDWSCGCGWRSEWRGGLQSCLCLGTVYLSSGSTNGNHQSSEACRFWTGVVFFVIL